MFEHLITKQCLQADALTAVLQKAKNKASSRDEMIPPAAVEYL
jgi:hypothetical protein